MAIFTISSVVLAQENPPKDFDGPPPPKRIDKKKMLERLTETLNLTAEQVQKIKEIDQSFEPQEKPIDDQIKALMEQKREIMKAKKAQIGAILTQEQKDKLKELRQQKRARRGPKDED